MTTAAVDSPSAVVPEVEHHRDRTWLLVLLGGTFVWLIAAIITAVTRDDILVPTVILVGGSPAPVPVIPGGMGLPRAGGLTSKVMFLGFLAGGTVGVLASALVETY